MDAHTHDIQKEVRRYLVVFAALGTLTIITVGISYLHVEIHLAIILALVVATIKGSLVCCYFMHLISERKAIYLLLGFVVFFFAAMMYLTVIHYFDTPNGSVQLMHRMEPADQSHDQHAPAAGSQSEEERH